MTEWIGVDLDGTLAEYHRGDLRTYGNTYIGPPVPEMVARVKSWLERGFEVRIFTARISEEHPGDLQKIRSAIELWLQINIGHKLKITNVKDYNMIELWDDRSIQVIPNTGVPIYHIADKSHELYERLYDERT